MGKVYRHFSKKIQMSNKAEEKMLNVSYRGNANPNHTDPGPHTHEHGYNDKDR